jgi:hypothetical protein
VLSLFDFAAVLITLTALFSWLNHRFIGLPRNIGLLLMGLAAATLMVLVEYAFPRLDVAGAVRHLRRRDLHDRRPGALDGTGRERDTRASRRGPRDGRRAALNFRNARSLAWAAR